MPFDRWFRYPAGFNQAVLDECFNALDLRPGAIVADPFAGAATVGTASLARRFEFRGIEAHPLIARLGALKMTTGPASDFNSAAQAVCEPLEVDLTNEHSLVRKCFEPSVLSTLVGIRERLNQGHGLDWTPWLTWALLATLRDVASVAVGWPYLRPSRARIAPHKDPLTRFRQRFAEMVEDLDAAKTWTTSGSVTHGDSRDPRTWQAALSRRSAAGSISSPPYLNNFDYADATRLELFFLREASSWRELCDRFRNNMLIATTQQTSRAQATADLTRIQTWPGVGERLSELSSLLTAERSTRPRGKEYDAAFAGYFVGIADVLEHLFKASKSGAKAAWVIGDSAPYGIFVDTPALIGEIANNAGFTVLRDVPLRTRGQRWRTNGSRHQVELTERLLVFAK